MNFFKRDPLDEAISQALDQLMLMNVEDEDYEIAVENVRRLYEAKLASKKSGFSPSSDAILAASVNILGIILILNYERLHVASSTAFRFIPKVGI